MPLNALKRDRLKKVELISSKNPTLKRAFPKVGRSFTRMLFERSTE